MLTLAFVTNKNLPSGISLNTLSSYRLRRKLSSRVTYITNAGGKELLETAKKKTQEKGRNRKKLHNFI